MENEVEATLQRVDIGLRGLLALNFKPETHVNLRTSPPWSRGGLTSPSFEVFIGFRPLDLGLSRKSGGFIALGLEISDLGLKM